ncbi:MAG: hypothetical protein KJZ55_07770 [Flavobacteriales bacterium]|nr:hypothetical protein [Flavobacteriales bacterium]
MRILNNNEFSIANAIRNFSLVHGGNGSKFYIGITNDIQRRLFDEHKVDEEKGTYYVREAISKGSAGKIEKYLLEKYPFFEGDNGGGYDYSVFIYIYKIVDTTFQRTNEGTHFDDATLITG